MSTDNKLTSKWWFNGFILPISVTVLGTGAYDWIKDKPILTTLWSFLKWLYNAVVNILNIDIKLWFILLFILIFYIAKFIYKLIFDRPVVETESLPEWIKYKQGVLKYWLWSWDYEREPFTGKIKITRLTPICQTCNTKMTGDLLYGGYYRCPRCEKTYDSTYNRSWESAEDIKALIKDNIEKGDYPDV